MIEEKKDPPIVPLDYLGGVKVIDFGDVRVARGMTRRAASTCRHRSIRYDSHERRIWCADCETTIEGYDAFVVLVEQFNSAHRKLAERSEAVAVAEASSIVSRAAKAIDRVWRSKASAPCCPHCREALLPEDFANGVGMTVSRELARHRMKRRLTSPEEQKK